MRSALDKRGARLTIYRCRGLLKKALTEHKARYTAGNLEGLYRQEDAELAVEVGELLQQGNVRAKGNKTHHLVISFHAEDRRLTPAELEDVVSRAVGAAGLGEHQYTVARHSEQEHEHLHVAVNKIHLDTLKIHHPYQAIRAFQALATALEEELGLRRVDRTVGRSRSHQPRDFQAHRGIESFARWARRNTVLEAKRLLDVGFARWARRNIGEAKSLDRIGSWRLSMRS